MSRMIVCDHCKRHGSNSEPNWRHVEYVSSFVLEQIDPREMDFCSLRCLADWAAARIKQEAKPEPAPQAEWIDVVCVYERQAGWSGMTNLDAIERDFERFYGGDPNEDSAAPSWVKLGEYEGADMQSALDQAIRDTTPDMSELPMKAVRVSRIRVKTTTTVAP